MTRLLFWIALVILVVLAIRHKLRQAARPPAARRVQPRPSAAEPEKMAQCAYCGVHFPASEAVRADELDYCCPAHVRQPPR